MGVIQNAINQMIGTSAMAARLSPSYEKRQEAAEIQKKGESATSGLKDIADSIERVKKSQSGEIPKDSKDYREPYSESELKDIRSRVGEHVSNIATLKTAAVKGHPLEKYVSKTKLQPRNEYSTMIKNIESSLDEIELKQKNSLKKAADKAQSQQIQLERFKEFSNIFTEGGRYK